MEVVRVESSSHWYGLDATPYHRIIGKNGNERNTTLADAKKLGLLPSTTTITGIVANPSLEAWKQEQILYAALTLPKLEDESSNDYVTRVILDSREHSKKAAEKGTLIHNAIEKYITDKKRLLDDSFNHLYRELDTHTFRGEFERRFACPKLGYAGSIDFIGMIYPDTPKEELAMIDFKTQSTKEGKYKVYDSWKLQLAAYMQGALDQGIVKHRPNLYNIIISTTEPLMWLYKYTEEEIDLFTDAFNSFKNGFYILKGLKRPWIS